jgi:F0F1-type ATP synthase assembly protein I
LPNKKDDPENRKILLQYTGMATQFLGAIGVAVFLGFKADEWLNWKMPVWVWVLPLLVITGMIYGVVRNSSKK